MNDKVLKAMQKYGCTTIEELERKLHHQVKVVGDMAVFANATKEHKGFIDANNYMVEIEAELREVKNELRATES